MGLSWRSNCGEGVGHEGVTNVNVDVDVNVAANDVDCNGQTEREREINRSGLGWDFVF